MHYGGHSQIGITLDIYSHVTATMYAMAGEPWVGCSGSQHDSKATRDGYPLQPCSLCWVFGERSGLAFHLGQLHPFTLVPLWGLARRCIAGQSGSGAAKAMAAPDRVVSRSEG